ncbi:MAG: LuxR C-terminal-related transcriptional regulator [Paracoccaceae bacterium]|nr:LuxR C-terminal-related transcriptional regulator [Paracoccaceae bacterium]
MDNLAKIAFEHAPIGMIYSEERVIRLCNPRFAAMFGYEMTALQGVSLSKLYPTSDEFKRIGALGVAQMARTGSYADERIMRRRSGALFWCRVRGQSLTPDTPFAKAVWSFADLSDERPTTDLTMRERQVAKMMVEGQTTKEIAHGLDISPRTVEVHRANLLKKMDARNSLELVVRLAGIPQLA